MLEDVFLNDQIPIILEISGIKMQRNIMLFIRILIKQEKPS